MKSGQTTGKDIEKIEGNSLSNQPPGQANSPFILPSSTWFKKEPIGPVRGQIFHTPDTEASLSLIGESSFSLKGKNSLVVRKYNFTSILLTLLGDEYTCDVSDISYRILFFKSGRESNIVQQTLGAQIGCEVKGTCKKPDLVVETTVAFEKGTLKALMYSEKIIKSNYKPTNTNSNLKQSVVPLELPADYANELATLLLKGKNNSDKADHNAHFFADIKKLIVSTHAVLGIKPLNKKPANVEPQVGEQGSVLQNPTVQLSTSQMEGNSVTQELDPSIVSDLSIDSPLFTFYSLDNLLAKHNIESQGMFVIFRNANQTQSTIDHLWASLTTLPRQEKKKIKSKNASPENTARLNQIGYLLKLAKRLTLGGEAIIVLSKEYLSDLIENHQICYHNNFKNKKLEDAADVNTEQYLYELVSQKDLSKFLSGCVKIISARGIDESTADELMVQEIEEQKPEESFASTSQAKDWENTPVVTSIDNSKIMPELAFNEIATTFSQMEIEKETVVESVEEIKMPLPEELTADTLKPVSASKMEIEEEIPEVKKKKDLKQLIAEKEQQARSFASQAMPEVLENIALIKDKKLTREEIAYYDEVKAPVEKTLAEQYQKNTKNKAVQNDVKMSSLTIAEVTHEEVMDAELDKKQKLAKERVEREAKLAKQKKLTDKQVISANLVGQKLNLSRINRVDHLAALPSSGPKRLLAIAQIEELTVKQMRYIDNITKKYMKKFRGDRPSDPGFINFIVLSHLLIKNKKSPNRILHLKVEVKLLKKEIGDLKKNLTQKKNPQEIVSINSKIAESESFLKAKEGNIISLERGLADFLSSMKKKIKLINKSLPEELSEIPAFMAGINAFSGERYSLALDKFLEAILGVKEDKLKMMIAKYLEHTITTVLTLKSISITEKINKKRLPTEEEISKYHKACREYEELEDDEEDTEYVKRAMGLFLKIGYQAFSKEQMIEEDFDAEVSLSQHVKYAKRVFPSNEKFKLEGKKRNWVLFDERYDVIDQAKPNNPDHGPIKVPENDPSLWRIPSNDPLELSADINADLLITWFKKAENIKDYVENAKVILNLSEVEHRDTVKCQGKQDITVSKHPASLFGKPDTKYDLMEIERSNDEFEEEATNSGGPKRKDYKKEEQEEGEDTPGKRRKQLSRKYKE